jgi:hypothetical protein
MEKTIYDGNIKLQLKAMDIGGQDGRGDDDANDNSVRDDIDMEKLRQNAKKIEQDYQLKRDQLSETKRKNRADEAIKKKAAANKPAPSATK